MSDEGTMLTFEPYIGMVVFKNGHRQYVQAHEIKKADGKYQWSEGRPFQREQLQELSTALREEQISSLKLKGLIPNHVLYFQPSIAGSTFCWYLEPQTHFITFTADVKIPTGKYKFPGLIFAVQNKELFIFAYKGKGKPTEKTLLFHAPFFNVYDSGLVCMGTISESRRKIFLDEEIDRWQRRFFGGRFTLAHGEDGRITKGFTFKDVYRAARRIFPEKSLKQVKKTTLGALIKKFVEGGKND